MIPIKFQPTLLDNSMTTSRNGEVKCSITKPPVTTDKTRLYLISSTIWKTRTINISQDLRYRFCARILHLPYFNFTQHSIFLRAPSLMLLTDGFLLINVLLSSCCFNFAAVMRWNEWCDGCNFTRFFYYLWNTICFHFSALFRLSVYSFYSYEIWNFFRVNCFLWSKTNGSGKLKHVVGFEMTLSLYREFLLFLELGQFCHKFWVSPLCQAIFWIRFLFWEMFIFFVVSYLWKGRKKERKPFKKFNNS